ncbi:MAG: alpha/beta fold hydrolase [Deltaproteobacteria bacterium]|nr:alpha/beta fold hydrolase [Deltaproteobacteria bacterium]
MSHSISRRFKIIVLSFVVLSLTTYFGISAYMASILTQTERNQITSTPKESGLAYEDISFPSHEDSLQLKGWFIPAPAGSRVIILVHGKAFHRANPEIGMLEIAGSLVKNGYNILMFDLRGWGESEGNRFSLGYFEQRDLKGAIQYLKGRGFHAGQIGIMGWSMGAAIAMITAGTTPVAAIVEDSGYADLAELLEVQIPQRSGLPNIFNFGIVNMVHFMYGANLYSLRPAESVSQITNGRIFVIHGEADDIVPVEHARRIFAVKANQKGNEMWLLPGIGHISAYKTFPTEYIKRVAAFFDRELIRTQ